MENLLKKCIDELIICWGDEVRKAGPLEQNSRDNLHRKKSVRRYVDVAIVCAELYALEREEICENKILLRIAKKVLPEYGRKGTGLLSYGAVIPMTDEEFRIVFIKDRRNQ